MRKSVEIGLEMVFLLILGTTLLPILGYVIKLKLLQTTSIGFWFLNIFIFATRVVLFQNLVRFAIDNHALAEVVEVIIELVQIILTFYSYYEVVINPIYVLTASFCLPMLHLLWIVKLGVIAFNKNIDV